MCAQINGVASGPQAPETLQGYTFFIPIGAILWIGSVYTDRIWPLVEINIIKEVGRFWGEVFCCAGHRWQLVSGRRQYRTKKWGGWFISKLLHLFVEELVSRSSPSLSGWKHPVSLSFKRTGPHNHLLLFMAVVRYPAVMSRFLCLPYLSRWAGSVECHDWLSSRAGSGNVQTAHEQQLNACAGTVCIYIWMHSLCVCTCVPGKVFEWVAKASQLHPSLEQQPCYGIENL